MIVYAFDMSALLSSLDRRFVYALPSTRRTLTPPGLTRPGLTFGALA